MFGNRNAFRQSPIMSGNSFLYIPGSFVFASPWYQMVPLSANGTRGVIIPLKRDEAVYAEKPTGSFGCSKYLLSFEPNTKNLSPRYSATGRYRQIPASDTRPLPVSGRMPSVFSSPQTPHPPS